MSKLNAMENVVISILSELPPTRNDDCLLMWEVCRRLTPNLLNKSFSDVMLFHTELGLPNIKTVERCRRKAQEKFPDLQATKEKKKQRKEEEKKYEEYSKT